MGCGGSKLDPEHESVPARLRPILRRRLEEIRARRNRTAANGLSKKELLGDGGTIDLSPDCSPDPSFHHTRDCPPSPQKITIDPNSPSGSKLDSLQEEDGSCEEGVDQRLNNGGKGLKAEREEEDEKALVEVEVEVEDDEEEEEEEDMMMVAPSSPSFRVYCMDLGDHDSKELGGKEELDGHEDQRIVEGEESTCSNEVSVKQPRKAKRGTMFKKMIPKGGKNIFNNKSFYNFPCSSNESQLLQKAAA